MHSDSVYDEIVGEAMSLCDDLENDEMAFRAGQLVNRVRYPESLTHWLLFVPSIVLRAWHDLPIEGRCLAYLSARESMHVSQGVYQSFIERQDRIFMGDY